jgi:hypothetical protein
MKVLVGCEFSQIVTKAFRDRGIEAFSCDLLPTEGNSDWHLQMDIFEAIKKVQPTLAIFHPPCTFLAVSGARWFKDRIEKQKESLEFVRQLMALDIPSAIENPIGVISTKIRKPDQIIQPWMFGHGETKATCLWLENLPKLQPTNIVSGREGRVWKESPGPNRWKNRSRTYQGVLSHANLNVNL